MVFIFIYVYIYLSILFCIIMVWLTRFWFYHSLLVKFSKGAVIPKYWIVYVTACALFFPAGNYISKLTIEILEKGIFIVNFENISHLVLVFLLLTLSRWIPAGFIFAEFLTHLLSKHLPGQIELKITRKWCEICS